MQMQILNTNDLRGLGTVLPFSGAALSAPVSMAFRSDGPLYRWRASKDVVLDYENGMALLVLFSPEGPLMFYLDRTVQLFPGTFFSIVPLDASCTIRLSMAPGDTLEKEECSEELLSASPPRLQVERIYTCFYQEYEGDFYFRGERHIPYELTYVDHGTLHTLVNGSDLVLREGDIAIIARNDWHMQYSESAVRFLTVTFKLSDGALDHITNKALSLPSGARSPVNRFLQQRNDNDTFSYDYLEALLKIVLIELLRSTSSAARTPVFPATSRAENQIMDQALQIIAQNYHHPISLKALAREVHVSVPYICRLFNTHLGIPPGQYITKVRMEECKDLLRQGTLSMGDIARHMGFSSPQHFSRQFKQYCGLTPSEYTKAHQPR